MQGKPVMFAQWDMVKPEAGERAVEFMEAQSAATGKRVLLDKTGLESLRQYLIASGLPDNSLETVSVPCFIICSEGN